MWAGFRQLRSPSRPTRSNSLMTRANCSQTSSDTKRTRCNWTKELALRFDKNKKKINSNFSFRSPWKKIVLFTSSLVLDSKDESIKKKRENKI
jgi:hypothetical protein